MIVFMAFIEQECMTIVLIKPLKRAVRLFRVHANSVRAAKNLDMSEFTTVNVFASSKRIRVKCKKHMENSYFEFRGFVFLIKRRKTALHCY